MSDYPQERIKPYNENESKATQVEKMFDNIAPSYDNLNHVLSLSIDKFWRRKAIKCLKPFQPKKILDVATGTGDFAIQACRMLNPQELIATDISEGMMKIGREKVKQLKLGHCISFAKEDCTHLSFEDNRFDAITVAFGIRNFENLDLGLKEMYRVLTPGGHLVILEFSEPTLFPVKQCYALYSKLVIPAVGRFFSKDQNAYRYLPASIKAFPQGKVMQNILQKAGFSQTIYRQLSLGICTLYFATK